MAEHDLGVGRGVGLRRQIDVGPADGRAEHGVDERDRPGRVERPRLPGGLVDDGRLGHAVEEPQLVERHEQDQPRPAVDLRRRPLGVPGQQVIEQEEVADDAQDDVLAQRRVPRVRRPGGRALLEGLAGQARQIAGVERQHGIRPGVQAATLARRAAGGIGR